LSNRCAPVWRKTCVLNVQARCWGWPACWRRSSV